MSGDDLKDLVAKIIDMLGLTVDTIEVSVGHRTIVAITSVDTTLLDPAGEHLRALNTIVRRLVEQKYGEEASNFLIDVNGHHEAQMEVVRTTARMFAQRARLFKREVEMDPMSAYERLIVHELFAEDSQIETRSEGEGKFRHIVLKPR